MDVKITYPIIKRRKVTRAGLRPVVFAVFVLAFLACSIINLCVGGIPWCLFVLGGEWMVWFGLVDQPLVEATLVNRLTAILLSAAAYLFLIDAFVGNGWASFVVPMVCVALLLVQGTLFVVGCRTRRQDLMPIVWMLLGSLLAILAALLGFLPMNWPTIVLGSLAFALIVTGLIVLHGPILRELQKKFHTR